MESQEFYEALVRSDPSYEGRFIVGVTTTGIFCRPTCRARKPLAKNCRFFPSVKEALLNGFRPCKLCRPLESRDALPEVIRSLLAEVEAHPTLRVSDRDLKNRKVDPSTIRRWFQKQWGVTFQGYQRARRLGEAFGQLRQGDSVARAAFDAGFESLSGFGHSFKKTFGTAPSGSSLQTILRFTRIPSPLGTMIAVASDHGLCLLEFADRRTVENEIEDLERLLKAKVLPGTSDLLDQTALELEAYFAGDLRDFTLPLVSPGTAFQGRVWEALRQIPYGETRSYAQQATVVGTPSAVRAVGTANGKNRLAIVIPCHRVVGSDGSLTGYGGGLWRKRWLLDWEKRHEGS